MIVNLTDRAGTDCGGADPDAPTVECTNTCQWANDDYCDDTRTSGLCDLGTDCHDCFLRCLNLRRGSGGGVDNMRSSHRWRGGGRVAHLYAVAAMPPRERVQHRHAIDASPNAGGPASKGNFTTFDDDGWWDDDENYWDDDYDWF